MTIFERGNPSRKRETSSRKLTDAEFKEKRDKGLCFHCNERYYQGHWCRLKEKRELNLIIAGEVKEIEDIPEEEIEVEVKTKALELTENMELALRSVYGFSAPGTMKLKWIVGGKEVVILINCGATPNFIHKKLVEELKLQVAKTSNYDIIVGNGTTIRGQGICKSVMVLLQGITMVNDFLPLDLGKMDVILGMLWLCTIGFMGVHWPTLTMTFAAGNEQVTLKGDPSLTRAEVSLKVMTITWEAEDQDFMIEFQNLEMEEEGDSEPTAMSRR